MDDTITLLSNLDLTTLERGNNDRDTLDMPEDETREPFEYIINRQAFRDAYQNWDHNASPLLTLHDELRRRDIYLGKPSAERVREAIQNQQSGAQLF